MSMPLRRTPPRGGEPPPSVLPGRRPPFDARPACEDLVDDSELQGLVGAHEAGLFPLALHPVRRQLGMMLPEVDQPLVVDGVLPVVAVVVEPPSARTTRSSPGPPGTSRTCRARPRRSRSSIATPKAGDTSTSTRSNWRTSPPRRTWDRSTSCPTTARSCWPSPIHCPGTRMTRRS